MRQIPTDEQERTDEFERLAGGVYAAGRLLDIYKNSYQAHGLGLFYGKSKEDVFRARAAAEGYSAEAVEALLRLQ